jgi:hypothetical protein
MNLVYKGLDYIDYYTRINVLYSEIGIYFLFDCNDKKLSKILSGVTISIFG